MEEGPQSLAPLDVLDIEGEVFLPGSSFHGSPQGEQHHLVALALQKKTHPCILARTKKIMSCL